MKRRRTKRNKKKTEKSTREMYRSYYVGSFHISTPFIFYKHTSRNRIIQHLSSYNRWCVTKCIEAILLIIITRLFYCVLFVEVPSYSNYLSLKLILNPVFFADVSHITYINEFIFLLLFLLTVRK